MISIQDSLRSICSEKEYVECLLWAEKEGYPLVSKWPADVSLAKATSTKEDWLENKEADHKAWTEQIPPLETSTLTIKQMHAYLSKILLAHPESSNMPIMRAEFGALTKSTCVEFDKETNSLYVA
jgi:hypothetical protein